jgi:hypothetical protein
MDGDFRIKSAPKLFNQWDTSLPIPHVNIVMISTYNSI